MSRSNPTKEDLMLKFVVSLATGLAVGYSASVFAVARGPVSVEIAGKDSACKPSGAGCKFGSECCSKVCKASYTCK
jgi:hypothetical protein